jgi:hypothetical protein
MSSGDLCCEKHYTSPSYVLSCLCEQADDADFVKKKKVAHKKASRETDTFLDRIIVLKKYAAWRKKADAESGHNLHELRQKSKVRQFGFSHIQSRII